MEADTPVEVVTQDMDNEANTGQNPKVPASGFRCYPSLNPTTKTKFVKSLQKSRNPAINPDVVWVASEKIHGANFSIFCDGNIVKYGRRNDYLTKQIPVGKVQDIAPYFNEEFFGCKTVVSNFHHLMGDLYQNIKKYFPDIKTYTVYGEYFGGKWTTPTPLVAVQHEVLYTPNHEFMAFDCLVKNNDESEKWIDVLDLEECLGKYLKVIPVFKRGTFEEVMNMDTVMDSTIPQLLGLEKVKNNIIEGMVIRPNKTMFVHDNRLVFKKKNPQFLEKVNEFKGVNQKPPKEGVQAKPKAAPKKVQPIVKPKAKDANQTMLDTLLLYLNKNRINSFVSKYPDVKDRNFMKTKIVQDILEDAENDELEERTEPIPKKVIQKLYVCVIRALDDYFANRK